MEMINVDKEIRYNILKNNKYWDYINKSLLVFDPKLEYPVEDDLKNIIWEFELENFEEPVLEALEKKDGDGPYGSSCDRCFVVLNKDVDKLEEKLEGIGCIRDNSIDYLCYYNIVNDKYGDYIIITDCKDNKYASDEDWLPAMTNCIDKISKDNRLYIERYNECMFSIKEVDIDKWNKLLQDNNFVKCSITR